ncbi:MAG TPA: type II toxin-antitoxin system VapC family toxin [Bryobacteraceae bacterium]|nr:type II toxin-antitoxin system VapC family toxin [Bryobacteraceae bacterium]
MASPFARTNPAYEELHRSCQADWPAVIVVDTNVVAYALIEGAHTPLALQVRKIDPAWRLPDLWRHEFLNILATYVRQGGTDENTARRLWLKADDLLAPATVAVDLSLALGLAVRYRISAYDAQFIALASTLGVPCVTEDRALQKAFPGSAVSMREFCRHLE